MDKIPWLDKILSRRMEKKKNKNNSIIKSDGKVVETAFAVRSKLVPVPVFEKKDIKNMEFSVTGEFTITLKDQTIYKFDFVSRRCPEITVKQSN